MVQPSKLLAVINQNFKVYKLLLLHFKHIEILLIRTMDNMDKDNSTEEVIMLPSIAPGPQYVVSLDSLDSFLIRNYTDKTSDEVKPLWSKSEMDGESTLCHVELHSNLPDEDYCVDSELDIAICHICNVEVPRTCYKKHMKSETHKIYLKLTKKIMENVTQHVKVNIDVVSIDVEENAYYCECCSKLVQVGCELKHNQSNSHLKSVENKNLTKKFLEMYTIKDMFDKIEKYYNDLIEAASDYESEDEDFVGAPVSPTNLSEHELEDDSDTDFEEVHIDACVVDDKAFITSASAPTSDELRKARKELMLCFKLYLKQDESKQNLKMPIIDTNSVIVETPKGYKEHISFDAFHSYKRMSNFVYCQVCQIWTDGKKLKKHSTSTKHISGIMQPLNDNFERELLNRCDWFLPVFGRRHCLLCNEAVLAHFNHTVNNPNHMKYKEEQVSIRIKCDKTFCEVCKVAIDTHNFMYHTKGNKHLKKAKKLPPVKNVGKVKEIRYFDPPKKTLDSVIIDKLVMLSVTDAQKEEKTYCSSCDVHIDTHNFLAHINAQKHKKILKKSMSKKAKPTVNKSNNMHVRDKSTLCNTCQVRVPKDCMAIHVQGKPHQKKSGMPVNHMTDVLGNKKITPSTSKPVRGKQSRSQRWKMRQTLLAELVKSDSK